jgi:hypothetical protein
MDPAAADESEGDVLSYVTGRGSRSGIRAIAWPLFAQAKLNIRSTPTETAENDIQLCVYYTRSRYG